MEPTERPSGRHSNGSANNSSESKERIEIKPTLNGDGFLNGKRENTFLFQNDDPALELQRLLVALDSFALVSKTDEHGVISYANKKFSDVSGYSVSELVGKPHSIVRSPFHPKEFFKKLWSRIKNGNSWQGEIQNWTKEKKPYWVYSLIVPTSFQNKKPREYLSIRFDITELKQANERQSILLEKLSHSNQELVDFSYHVAHDLKSPLHSIQMGLEMLLRELKESKSTNGVKTQDTLEVIINRIKRLEHLISGLLDLARVDIESNEREQVQVSELIKDVIDLIDRPEKSIAYKINVGDLVLRAEKIKMHQLFQNLLSNAVKFIDKSQGVIEIGMIKKKEGLCLFVSDNGPGIKCQDLEKIFDLFVTCAPPTIENHNTGVGLASVKKIVSRYGGRIWAESVPAQGATFFFTLPKALVISSVN